MKSFKELIRSRRGIAIEFAIGVMLISVAISTILISTAVLEGERRRSDMDKFNDFMSQSQSISNLEAILEARWDDLRETGQVSNIEFNGKRCSLNRLDANIFQLCNEYYQPILTITTTDRGELLDYTWH